MEPLGVSVLIKGGATAYDVSGTPALVFTTAPSLATYTAATFVTRRVADFTSAVMSMERLRERSRRTSSSMGAKQPQIKPQ